MASMLQQSLGFLKSLSLSRRFLMKIDPERSKRWKRVTSKPPTRWAIKTLKRNIDLGGLVAIALEEDSCKLRMLASPPSFNLTARLGFLIELD